MDIVDYIAAEETVSASFATLSGRTALSVPSPTITQLSASRAQPPVAASATAVKQKQDSVTGAIMFDTSVFYTLQTTTPSSHVVHSIHAGWL